MPSLTKRERERIHCIHLLLSPLSVTAQRLTAPSEKVLVQPCCWEYGEHFRRKGKGTDACADGSARHNQR